MSTTLSYDELNALAQKLDDETITEDEKFILLQALDKGLDEVLEMIDEAESQQSLANESNSEEVTN